MEAFAGTPGLVRPLSYNASRCRGISRKAHKLPQLPRRLLWRGAGPGADALTTRTNDPDANTKGEVFCVVAALTGFDRQMKNQMEMRRRGCRPQVVSSRNGGVNLHRKREVVGVNVRVGREDRDANRDLWINIDV
jgi:hypothetical protein